MVKINKIYTRTGDDGTSGLVDGSRVAKFDKRMQAIGDVDECNSALGLAINAMLVRSDFSDICASLRTIQNDLFDLGADIATPAQAHESGEPDYTPSDRILRITAERTSWLESLIDNANDALEPLTSFILPGGSAASSALHLARAVTRRAERSMVAAHDEYALNPAALTYINRLSDLLFTLCRVMNDKGKDDILWIPGGAR